MKDQRERMLAALIEADLHATESGLGASPMSRVRAEYIADQLLAKGALFPPRDTRANGVCGGGSGWGKGGLHV